MSSHQPLDAFLAAACGALAHLHLPCPDPTPRSTSSSPTPTASLSPTSSTASPSSHPLLHASSAPNYTTLHCPKTRRLSETLGPIPHTSSTSDALAHNLHLLECAFEQNGKEFQPQLHQLEVVKRLIHEKKADFDGFLCNLGFAKVGVPPPLAGIMATPPPPFVSDEEAADVNGDKAQIDSSPQPRQRLPVPLANVERLQSTLSTVSLMELIELVPQLVGRSTTSADGHPDRKKLFSVQDFFKYAEFEGNRFFEELDRDGDDQATLEDLGVAMRRDDCR